MTEAEALKKLREITNPEDPETIATAIAAAIEGQQLVLSIITIRRAVYELEQSIDGADDYDGELNESIQLLNAGAESLLLDTAKVLADEYERQVRDGERECEDEKAEPEGCGSCFVCLMRKAAAETGNN